MTFTCPSDTGPGECKNDAPHEMPEEWREVFMCLHCGCEVVWAQGLRWMPNERRLVDVRHLILVGNRLYSGRCPSSPDPEMLHEAAVVTPPPVSEMHDA